VAHRQNKKRKVEAGLTPGFPNYNGVFTQASTDLLAPPGFSRKDIDGSRRTAGIARQRHLKVSRLCISECLEHFLRSGQCLCPDPQIHKDKPHLTSKQARRSAGSATNRHCIDTLEKKRFGDLLIFRYMGAPDHKDQVCPDHLFKIHSARKRTLLRGQRRLVSRFRLCMSFGGRFDGFSIDSRLFFALSSQVFTRNTWLRHHRQELERSPWLATYYLKQIENRIS